jgi:DNA (cytosine-5)-methyltransferase 1
MLRAVKEILPDWITGENVPGIINWSKGLVFEQVQTDLEDQGYEVFSFVLPACGINAPHKRDRVWIVAHSCNNGLQGRNKGLQTTSEQGHDEKSLSARELYRSEWGDRLPKPSLFRNDDGLSKRLVDIAVSEWRNESIKGFGNAIVPQVAYQIFKTIQEYENLVKKK